MRHTEQPVRPVRRWAAAGAAAALTAGVLVTMTGADASEGDPRTAALVQAQAQRDPDKSFAVYIGKNRTANGHPFIGGFGHEPSSHWIDIVPRRTFPEGTTVEVGVTEDADIPGKLTRIPQARQTARYITSNYSEFAGFPAPLTNGGLNEHGVAARDVWSNSRAELVEETKTPQTGPSYSDLSRFAMERAHTAREAVQILGGLIDKYGYSTYGGNSHMFADENEGWVFLNYAGGQGLWAAQRLGPDDVRVSYPGYIHDFPTDFADNPDFMGSANLVSYAKEKGWWKEGEPFDLQKVYGEPFPGQPFEPGEVVDPQDPGPYRHPPSLEKEFQQLKDVKLQDVMRIVRDPRWADDRSGYGQVAEPGSEGGNGEMATLWTAVTSAATAPFIPVHVGETSVPPEYRQHRYLTHNSASNYLDPAFAEQEATESATQTFKRLMYATCSRKEDEYLTPVNKAFEGFEASVLKRLPGVEAKARAAYASGDTEKARKILTEAGWKWSYEGLDLGDYLLDKRLRQLRADGGIRDPQVEGPEGSTANAQSLDMSLRASPSARERFNCDHGGGWPSGSLLERAGSYGDPADVPAYQRD